MINKTLKSDVHVKDLEKTGVLLSAKQLVDGSVRLVSLPEVCIRINEMLDDPNVTVASLGSVIIQDTSLTARLLKMVNSSFYGYEAKVETVSRAVTVIGLRELRGLVIAASAIEMFSAVPEASLNKVRFWRHSLYCGVIARLLAEQCNVLHSERLFVAGLLHDIGKLIIAQRLPDVTKQILEEVQLCQRPEIEIEKAILGFTHAEVGCELMTAWNMPEALINSVSHHHAPQAAENGVMETCLVHIANCLTDEAENGLDMKSPVMIKEVQPFAWEMTGLDESVKQHIFAEAGPMFAEALEIILPRSYPPY